ncbi:GGDEF domain-containing protein [Aeromonas sp. FDAARGOS 1415]|uniref:GGDEF domain-containing protein n=1 Tax=Aeromonas TaxID=642 RepID=UPI0020B27673|nr:GGDEF domain-containing protein [Aeromonas sp. FDAARGOS 1415]
MLQLRRLWWLLSLLMVASLLLVALFEWGPRRHLVIVPSDQWEVATIDDRPAGGDSVATLASQGTGMTCELGSKYRWPYCELAITLASPELGIDLSDYDNLILQLAGEGPSNAAWRIYLRNYHPDYSRDGDPVSHKVNAILFDPGQYPGRVEVPLKLFTPATWWLTDYDIPLMQQGQDLSRVFAIELATGSGAAPGHYRLKVETLLFEGPWMPPSLFYRALFIGWSLAVISLLLMDYLGMRRRLAKMSRQARQTMARNRDLELEYRMASNQVRYDPLTGALSRYEGESRLVHHDGEMTLVFIDIDHFKQINDSQGHPVGDEVLKCLVSELLLQLEEGDMLCRWGGEEFVLLLPGRSLVWGQALAERLRLAVAGSRNWPNGVAVTASFGVASRQPDEPMSKTLQRADMALYRAKGAGRNRVEVAD